MMLLFISTVIASNGLKLLEMDTPLKPFKPAYGNVKSVCKPMELWGTVTPGKKAADGEGTLLPHPSPGSACAIEQEAGAVKAYKAIIACATTDNSCKLKAVKEFGNILDRCCQSTYDAFGDGAGNPDATTKFNGQTNVGFGKKRLPGVAATCVGWSIGLASGGAFGVDPPTSHSDFVVSYWRGTAPSWETPSGACYSTSCSWMAVYHWKVASAAASTTANGVISPDPAVTCAAGDVNNGVCLGRWRKQCMSGAWAANTGWQLDYSPGIYTTKCAGFCTDITSTTVTFYKTNYCYLDKNGGDDANMRCWATKAPAPNPAQMPAAFNDPKIVNMAGEQFEILTTGTFSMLNVQQSAQSNLQILATIDRAGSRCGATYIQNVSLSGEWISQLGMPSVLVRAAAAVPKKGALQVSIDEEHSWQQYSEWKTVQNMSFDQSHHFKLQLKSVTVEVSVDSHRIVESGKKTRRFANFLDLNIQGIHQLPKSYTVSGLLGNDDHSSVTALPDDCHAESFALRTISRATLKSQEEAEEPNSQAEAEEPEDDCPLEVCGATLPDN